MTVPLIGIGHDLTLEQLSEFIVEPNCPDGVHNAQRDIASDRSRFEAGLHAICIWDVIDGIDDLQALLAQMGIHSGGFLRQAVTVYLPVFDGAFHRYNGYANRPQMIRYAFFPVDLRVVFDDMTQID